MNGEGYRHSSTQAAVLGQRRRYTLANLVQDDKKNRMQDLITDELMLASPQATLCENETESVCCQVLLEEGVEGSEHREKGQGGVVALHVRFSPEMDGGGAQGPRQWANNLLGN
jgi:uncharacterized metal-binding protein YceD (DUF177 family)